MTKQTYRPIHSLTFLRQVEDAIWARLGRKVLLDDLSATNTHPVQNFDAPWPEDVFEGIQISISKIRNALAKATLP